MRNAETHGHPGVRNTIICLLAVALGLWFGTQLSLNRETPAPTNGIITDMLPSDGVVADNVPLGYDKVEVGTTPAPPPALVPVQPEPVATTTPELIITVPSPGPEPAPVPVVPDPEPLPEPPAVVSNELAMIAEIQAQYGQYARAGTVWTVGPMPAGYCDGGLGCTIQTVGVDGLPDGASISVTILPGHVTPYVVMHEIAHTNGILDECAADQWALSIVGGTNGHYC